MGKCIVLGVLLCLFQAEQTGSIEGTVQEQDGTVAPGIHVFLVNLTADGPILRETVTDEEGRYKFEDLVQGSYVVEHELGPLYGTVEMWRGACLRIESLTAADRAQLRMDIRTWVSGALAWGPDVLPQRIEMKPGSTREHDLRLPDFTNLDVRVRIGDQPLPYAEVHLLALIPLPGGGFISGLAWPYTLGGPDTNTDETGTVSFARVRPGSYAAMLRIGAWLIEGREHEVPLADRTTLPIEVGPYSIRVRVLDHHGKPVTACRPRIRGTTLHLQVWSEECLESDGGIYWVPYLLAGDYVAEATAGWGNGSARAHAVRVSRESPSPEVTLHLPPTGSVEVRVSASAGGEEPSVGILLSQKGQAWDAFRTAECPGSARFDHLTAGTYLVGRHPGPLYYLCGSQLPSYLPFSQGFVEVEIKPDETTEVTLVVPEEE